MQRVVVGVMRGGPSSEYEVSLQSGATVLAELDQSKYEPKDLFISRDGTWHKGGREVPLSKALQGIDVIFNALHGEYGEDGTVQRILDTYGIPYTGSGPVPSAMAINKPWTKEILGPHGIKMAQGVVLDLSADGDLDRNAKKIFDSFCGPWVVKPAASGSSVGVTIVKEFQNLPHAFHTAHTVGPKILVEEFIDGREATVGVAEKYRGEDIYSFFPVEIVPPTNNKFYDYEAKYISDDTQYLLPGNFTDTQKQELSDIAKRVHKELALSHYSRSDFIVAPKGIYFLEVNTLPGLTTHSLIPKAVRAAGGKLADFFDHLIKLALEKK